MIDLLTLGTLDLRLSSRGDSGTVVAQPKRAALLVYLARATPTGFQRRDRLLALLWPELDEAHGRTALRQAVYRLRQALGKEAIGSRGDEELRVDPAVVGCDAAEFERLLAEGRPAEALGLYRGDFLDGFHVAGASEEWEQWVERERSRLRHRAQEACRLLACDEEKKGNSLSAAGWARRALELAPDDEATALELLRLLQRLGDRSGALRAGTAFVAQQRALLGAEPSPTLVALLDELRGAPAPVAKAAPSVLLPDSTPSSPLPVGPPLVLPARARWRPGWVALTAGLALLFAGLLAARLRERQPAPRPLVAVGLIRNVGAETDRLSAPMLRDLLTTGLAQLPELEVLSGPRLIELETQVDGTGDPASMAYAAAKLAGATLLIEGELRAEGESLRVALRATEIPRGAIRYTVQASGASLFALADAATAQLAARSGATPLRGGPAPTGTRSELAYRLYLEGLRAYYATDGVAARRLFDAAIQEDSGFAMAWLYASRAAADPAQRISALREAVRRASAASDRERLTILARWAFMVLDPAARAYAETLAVRYPSEPANLLLLAQAQNEFGAPEAALDPARRVIALDAAGAAGRTAACYACDAWITLIGSNLDLGGFDAALAAARDFARQQPHSALALQAVYAVLVRLDRYQAADSVRDLLDSVARPDPLLLREERLRRGAFGELLAEVRATAERGPAEGRADARWWETIALRTQGRYGEALAVARLDGGIAEAQVLCESGEAREGARRFEAIANQVLRQPADPANPAAAYHRAKHRAWYLTHAATCLNLAGDTTRLARLADTIQAIGAHTSWPRDQRLHYYVRGLLARQRQDTTGAIALFRLAVASPVNGLTRINYELAGLLLARGETAEAIRWLQLALRGPVEAGGLYLTRRELEERLAQAFRVAGPADSARVHERYVTAAAGRGGE